MFEALVKKDKFTLRDQGKAVPGIKVLHCPTYERRQQDLSWSVYSSKISKFPDLEFPQMVDIESCSVLRKRENIKLEKSLTLEEGEIMSLQQMPTAHHTLRGMRSCMKNKARRDYDCTTA